VDPGEHRNVNPMKVIRRRIGVIGPYGHLGTVPSPLALIESLADRNYGVDLYACEDDAFPPLSFAGRDVRVFVLATPYRQGEAGWRWQFFRRWMPYLLGRCAQERYSCLIGVDPWGLVLASISGRFRGIPVIYFSLEIYQWRMLKSPYLRALKLLERLANRAAAFTIIQDWDRGALLMRENHISRGRIEILPNAPRGEASAEKTDDLHRAMRIDRQRQIVLHIGSIYPLQTCLELARCAKLWDSNWAMVFHSRSRLLITYTKELRRVVDNRQVYLSDQPLSGSEQIRRLVASAHVGVALYPMSINGPHSGGCNVHTMGRSSGKIAHYLQCGLPVVVSDLPSLRAYVDRYRCGVCVSDVENVGIALKTIFDDYDRFSANALTCFREAFDFESHFVPIATRLDRVASGRFTQLGQQTKKGSHLQ
jgi:glycosyltransferase involved in cell wall biosynthesis